MGRYIGPVEFRESSAARLLCTPGLQHDQAQAALAASFSVTALAAPGALLDEASLQCSAPASSTSPNRRTRSPTS